MPLDKAHQTHSFEKHFLVWNTNLVLKSTNQNSRLVLSYGIPMDKAEYQVGARAYEATIKKKNFPKNGQSLCGSTGHSNMW